MPGTASPVTLSDCSAHAIGAYDSEEQWGVGYSVCS